MKPPQQTVKITERALFQRINRKLKHKNQHLRTSISSGMVRELGRFYAVDFVRHCIVAMDVNLEEWGNELEVLQPWEQVED